MIKHVVIADVTYTSLDETHYVSPLVSRYSNVYCAPSFKETVARLEADGWEGAGMVCRWDDNPVGLWQRKAELVAVWTESDEDRAEREALR